MSITTFGFGSSGGALAMTLSLFAAVVTYFSLLFVANSSNGAPVSFGNIELGLFIIIW